MTITMEQQTYDLLKRYVTGQMQEAERTAFEQRLKADTSFAEEVAAWATIQKGIQAEGDRRLSEELHALGKKLMQENAPERTATTVNAASGRVFHLPRWVYAAAAVFLLLLIAWPVYRSLQPSAPTYAYNSKSVFEQHFRAAPPPEVRDAEVAPWQKAYQNKQYDVAVAALEKLLADPNYGRRSEAQLYLGISHLAAGRGRQALDALQKVSPDSYDWDEAQWYSALAYVIVDDVVQAKQILHNIAAQPGNPRQKEAQQLLESLK